MELPCALSSPKTSLSLRDGLIRLLSAYGFEVLAAPANAIAARLYVTEKAVGKHINGIFGRLGREQFEDDNRRVLAVLVHFNV